MMKKHVFSLIAALALLCLLSACFPEPEPPPPPPESTPEKTYYTMRLVKDNSDTIGINVGGGVSKSVSGGSRTLTNERALTSEVAQAFHDFFEVVFYYNGAPNTVARTTWNVGETPEIRGVYRGTAGINYSGVGVPASGSGSAVLFVGSKDDKTLLAVGYLSHVDNAPGTLVLPDTTAVTFEVTALRAGARFDANKNDSAFFTDFTTSGTPSAASTSVSPQTGTGSIFIHHVDKKRFPLYRLRHEQITNASYRFDIAKPAVYSGPEFNEYGILLAGGWNCEARQPRYIITDGLYQTSSIFPQAIKQGTTELALMTNNTSGPSFANPVTFRFNTANSQDGSIFALTFEIMVYNLTSSLTTMPGSQDAEPVKWRLSTGMGTKWLDLDDGLGGEGGAILLGSGTGNILTDRLVPYNWN